MWRTTDASTWVQLGQGQLPTRCLSSIAIDASQPCTAASCTLYVTALGFSDGDSVPGHVFRSSDAGLTWADISGPPCTGSVCTSLPDVPALSSVVIHPSDPKVIYVAALFYSLVESAKLSGVEPAAYLRQATQRAIANPGTVTLPADLFPADTS